jgi:hypothetical protein
LALKTLRCGGGRNPQAQHPKTGREEHLDLKSKRRSI